MWLTLEQTSDASSTLTPTWRKTAVIESPDYEANVQTRMDRINLDSSPNNSRRSSTSSHSIPSLQAPVPTPSPLISSTLSIAKPSPSNGRSSLALPQSAHLSPSIPPPSPRARFAANPIIGPTRSPSPLPHRRKSALKYPSPHLDGTSSSSIRDGNLNPLQLPNPSVFDVHADFSTSDVKQRHRTLSAAVQGTTNFGSHQRAHSVSDFSPGSISSDLCMPAAEVYDSNHLATLATSNPRVLSGLIVGEDELLPENTFENSLHPTSKFTHGHSRSSEAGESGEFRIERPSSPSSISSHSSSSFELSSALTFHSRSDSGQSASQPKFMVRPLKLRPHVLPPSLAPEPPESLGKAAAIQAPSLYLDIQSHPPGADRNTSGRKRSGTLVAFKNVKVGVSMTPQASSSTTQIPPVPPVPNLDQLPVPPPRPPRSTRRTNQPPALGSAASSLAVGLPTYDIQTLGTNKENVAPESFRNNLWAPKIAQASQSTGSSTTLSSNASRVPPKPAEPPWLNPPFSSLIDVPRSSGSVPAVGQSGHSTLPAGAHRTATLLSSPATLPSAQGPGSGVLTPSANPDSFSSRPATNSSPEPHSCSAPRERPQHITSALKLSQTGKQSEIRYCKPSVASSGTDDEDFQSADEGDEEFWQAPSEREDGLPSSHSSPLSCPAGEFATTSHLSIETAAVPKAQTQPSLPSETTSRHQGISHLSSDMAAAPMTQTRPSLLSETMSRLQGISHLTSEMIAVPVAPTRLPLPSETMSHHQAISELKSDMAAVPKAQIRPSLPLGTMSRHQAISHLSSDIAEVPIAPARPSLPCETMSCHQRVGRVFSNPLQSPFENSFGSSSSCNSQTSPINFEGPFQRATHSVASAFPRSDSMFSSYSAAAMSQDSAQHNFQRDSLSSMAGRSARLLSDLMSAQPPSSPQHAASCPSPPSSSTSEKQFGTQSLPPAVTSNRMFESPQPGPSLSEGFLTPYSAERDHSSPASFVNADISRASSIEGLAALRNRNSPKVTPNPKKPSSRSSSFRQISSLLTKRSRESLLEDETHPPHSSVSKISAVPVQTSIHGPPPATVSGTPHLQPALMPQTWKSANSAEVYETLLRENGTRELRRQEVVWELCQTELSFVDGMRRVIDIFAAPLRTPRGTWIDGVPTSVAKLLDWLEDVVNVHAEMALMVERYRHRQMYEHGLVLRIADAFLMFIPRLEVYQPYLIRFSAVTESIEDMTCDIESDFGEFVRMQTSLPECGHMNLPSFLLKPVQRLMKYPLFFKQMCDLTPSNHPDHTSTTNLLHATDSIIRILQEVKGREDEYENLKVLQARIKGLPAEFRLAKRDRMLLAQGLLRRVEVSSRDLADFEPDSKNGPGIRPRPRTSVSSPSSAFPLPSSTSYEAGRPLSHSSDHSELSQSSVQSKSLTPYISENSPTGMWARRSAPSSDEFVHPNPPSPTGLLSEFDFKEAPVSMPPETPHNFSGLRDLAYKSHLDPSSGSRTRQRTITPSRLIKRAKELPVHVFVFSDLIILATRHNDGVRLIKSSKLPSKKKEQTTHYCALESIGLSRVLNVEDVSGELGYKHLIKVEVLPIGIKNPAGSSNEFTFNVPVFFTFPDRLPGSRYPAPKEVLERERHKWLAAFDKSLRVSRPTPTGNRGKKGRLEPNILMARSPSDPVLWNTSIDEQESEERDWWMYRHHTVKGEIEAESRENSDQSESPKVTNRSVSHNAGPAKPLSRTSSVISEPRRRLPSHPRQKNGIKASSALGLTMDFL